MNITSQLSKIKFSLNTRVIKEMFIFGTISI